MSDVGQAALAVVGGVVGAFFGNPYLGFVAGSTVGGLLFPGETEDIRREGPRLSDLRIQESSYGGGIPIVFGTVRIAGNLIWSTPLIETATTTSQEIGGGGKGGAPSQTVTTTEYTYSVHCVIRLCQGEILGVRRIWANGKLMFNIGASASYATQLTSQGWANAIRILPGSETQGIDPTLDAYLGANAPAYRGTAGAVLVGMQLAQFGNRIPNLEFEVVRAGSSADSVSYIDTPNTFPSVVNGSIGRNGLLIVIWITQASPYQGKMALADPYTGALIRELPAHNYMGSDYPDGRTKAPAMNSNDDIVFYDGLQRVWVWPNGGVPNGPYGADTGTRFAQDENGNIYFGMRYSVSPVQRYVLKVSPGATAPILFYSFGTGFCYDVFCDFNNHLLATEDISTTHFVHEINLTTGLIERTYAPPRKVTSMAVAGDGSLWYTNGNSIWRVAPNWGSEVSIYTGTVHTGSDQVRINRDWKTGDIIFADLSMYRRYAADGTLINFYTSNTAYQVVSDAYWPNQVYAFNSVQNFGANAYILVERTGVITPGNYALADAFTEICETAGLSAGDIDVSGVSETVRGFVIANRMRASDAIAPLLQAYGYDIIESGSKIKFIKKNAGSVGTIAYADLGARLAGADGTDVYAESRVEDAILPHEIAVNYLDSGADYQVVAQYARRIADLSENDTAIQLPLVLTANEARQTAETMLYEAWIGRSTFEISTSRKWSKLEPGDHVTLELEDATVAARITRKTEGGGLIRFQLIATDAAVYTQTAEGATGLPTQTGVGVVSQVTVFLLDIGLLRSVDDDYGIYVAAAGVLSPDDWAGGKIYKSSDDIDYVDAGISFSASTTFGYTTTQLGTWVRGNQFDAVRTVTVALSAGSLTNATQDQVLAGANAALIGNEIIQFTTVSQSGNLHTLSGLLRGRLGTTYASGRHYIGERFILLDTAMIRRLNLAQSDQGTLRYYKGASFGGVLPTSPGQSFTLRSRCLQPVAPVHLGGGRNATNDLTIKWIRCARSNTEWLDAIDVPLDESTESYEVDVYAGTTATITAITRASDGVVTTSGAHGYSTNDYIYITGVSGMTQINDRAFQITVLTTTTFSVGIETATFDAYSSGGTTRRRGNSSPLLTSSESVTYSSSAQSTDYGGPQATVYCNVFQISSRVGRGEPLTGAR